MQTANTLGHIDRGLLTSARAGALLVLAMPLVITQETLFPFVVGKALYSRILIEVSFALWLVLAVRNPSYRPVLSPLILAFAVYVAISLLAGLTGVSLQRSLWSTYERMQGIVDLAHWLAFALVLTSLFRTPGDWRQLLNVNLLIGSLMALLGAALILGWQLPVYGFLEAGQRIGLTLGNPAFVGSYMLVNALIGAGFLAHSFSGREPEEQDSAVPGRRRGRRSRGRRPGSAAGSNLLWWRLFWGGAICLSLWMVLESGTRAPLVALAGALAALTVAYVLWGRRKRVKVALAAALACLLLLGMFLVLGANTPLARSLAERSHLVERVTRTAGGTDFSLATRLLSVSYGLQGFAERPALGWGPENYIVAWGRHYDGKNVGDGYVTPLDQAHNRVVEELTTRGVVGLAGYLSLWVLMLWKVASRLRRLGADREMLALFMGSAIAAHFILGLALFDTPATLLQFVLLLGFAVRLDTTLDIGEKPPQRTAPSPGAVFDRFGLRSLASRACRSLGTPVVGWAGAAVLAAALAAVVYMGNVRVYQAAAEGQRAVAHRTLDWPSRLQRFDRSISLFPPLANSTRQDLFDILSADWNTLSSREEAVEAMQLVQPAAAAITGSEPHLWSAYVSLARVYQNAALLDPWYLETARSYRATAEALAPRIPQVIVLKARQEMVEEAIKSSPGH